ncbi:MAG: thioesterase family protein [Bryobacteraceae bacterium]
MKPPHIAFGKITALEPVCLRATVPEAYRDNNGHMNARWYLALFDDASDALHEWIGLTPEYHAAHHTGTMDLEHHIHYLNEVMPGEVVTVYVRFVGSSSKHLHYLMFLVDDTRGRTWRPRWNASTHLPIWSGARRRHFRRKRAAKIAAGLAVHGGWTGRRQ